MSSLALPSHFTQHYQKSVSVAACTMFYNNTANSVVADCIRHNSPVVDTLVIDEYSERHDLL